MWLTSVLGLNDEDEAALAEGVPAFVALIQH
jgi:hypothetical protein